MKSESENESLALATQPLDISHTQNSFIIQRWINTVNTTAPTFIFPWIDEEKMTDLLGSKSPQP